MFSFLANKETEHTDPVLFPSNHGPEVIPQTSHKPHGMCRSVPRLASNVHVTSTDIEEVVQGHIIKRHIIHAAIKLVLMESNKAPMINQVVHQQPTGGKGWFTDPANCE